MFPPRKPRSTQPDVWAPSGSWDDPPQNWGSHAPKPCVCSLIPRKTPKHTSDDSDASEGETEKKFEPAFDFDGIIERKDHYLVREQIWYEGIQRWVPYDASRFEIPVPEQDLGNYFYVNIRHYVPGDQGELVLTNFSETLLKFLRTSYGNEFYSNSPERTADSLLPDIPILKSKLANIEKHLSVESTSLEDKRALATSLGSQEAKQATHLESHINQFLAEAKEHITVLYDYLLELYKPKAEKLALQLSDGCIEFDLLVFYYELNKRYCLDPSRPTIALGFRLDSRGYDSTEKKSLRLSGTAYSWSGTEYTRTSIDRYIARYRGTKDLRLLECQPLTAEIEAALVARGRMYTALSGCHYRSYLKDRIIVDKIGYGTGLADSSDRESIDSVPEFPEEDLWMLPGTVFGFNLTKKMWTSFPVLDIGPVIFDGNAWDHLVLDPEAKILIKSLVQVTRNSNKSNIISDVITGKGGGLIAVLHGNPGTGKTLTAEAVAETLKRPLYIVGASELSTKPAVLEEKLKAILSLATAWDAVLLIDEADVFLEQRSLHEIERNSLVSVALRVLEYHRGVLFLTTNRIQTFDAAFLSRFSIAIKYPEHDLASRRVIWRKFFELAGVKTGDTAGSGRSTPTDMVKLDDPSKVAVISDAELDELAEKPFNGRTIKNLVRTAQALALSANEPVSKYHVDIVVRSQEKFLREFAGA